MTKSNGVRQLAGVTDATPTGVLFFIIVGVFGLQFAIAGLMVFVIVAVATYRVFPEGAES
ncbi:MAG TPA: hypothetical protein VE242_06285 [Chthoniobacterales bacterium]|nr:hypothetical protein [Chthoniobacterales bacterium]